MSAQANKQFTTIALSKGRIFDECRELLEKIGITVAQKELDGRKLVLPTNKPDVRLLIIRATDVPTYVQYGAAELGVVGKDTLMEFSGDGIYEPLDLGIAKCQLMAAGVEGKSAGNRRMRVATKYLQSTRRYFASKGQQVELIKLYGSMELAPLLGLADCIVDLVATGSTLKANGLVATEHIADISSRLIVNKAAMKIKSATLKPLIEEFRLAVEKP
ncbi:MAG: ATP phosphoribosyltransferase [Gammaproteobacteria bacterium]|nr:MAG: ATP phosphoribosyltransferase [Gammaproteobacteria bacterium]